jgi:hypothetical protein
MTKTFVFNGEEGTDHIEINLPPGEHSIDLISIWKTNGVAGNRDQFLGKIKCENPEAGIGAESSRSTRRKKSTYRNCSNSATSATSSTTRSWYATWATSR